MTDDPVITFMIRQPGLVDTLLTQHFDDGTGHCSSCSIGASAGNHRWPCTIAHFVEQAVRIRGAGRRPT